MPIQTTQPRWGKAVLAALIVASPQVEAASPDKAFLEYLAGMVEEDGQWIDPLAMADLEEPASEEAPPVSWRHQVDDVNEEDLQAGPEIESKTDREQTALRVQDTDSEDDQVAEQ